jgi:hypothetical protein
MATIRKRDGKFQVQVRRTGQPHISKTFHLREDARAWGRQMELVADRQEIPTMSSPRGLCQ